MKNYNAAIVSILASGTSASLLGKSLYVMQSIGIHKQKKPFSKPLASTLFMFVGMLICLPLSMLYNSFSQRRVRQTDNDADLEEPLHATESAVSLHSVYEDTIKWWHSYDSILIPTIFDLVATALMSTGLLFVTTSVYQMVRGTEIIFTALLTVFLLRRKLNVENILGLFFCLCGILIVGYASILDASSHHHPDDPLFTMYSRSSSSSSSSPDNIKNSTFDKETDSASYSSSTTQTMLGMLLIIAAEAVQSSQVIAEDYLMTIAPSKVSPISMVGYEGVFGTLLMLFVVLPVAQFTKLGEEGSGLHEDSIDSFVMVRNSRQLTWVITAYIACMSMYNVAGMIVTDQAGALTRTVTETIRTLLVWVLDLALYYYGRTKTAQVGEPWTAHSWIQVLGFVVLFAGSVLYGYGDEQHAKELERGLQEKARRRWGSLRTTLSFISLVKAAEQQHLRVEEEEKRVPIKRPRIAGPSRIRTALHQLRRRRGGGGGDPDGML